LIIHIRERAALASPKVTAGFRGAALTTRYGGDKSLQRLEWLDRRVFPKLDPRFDHSGLEYALHDEMPLGWRHAVTGRTYHRDDPVLERLGIYVRRARYIVGRSQQSIANEAGIPQSQLSRLERALAPSMDVERLAWIEDAFHGSFPVGYCPHDHVCQWQRLAPRPSAEDAWKAETKRQEEISRLFGIGRDSGDAEADSDEEIDAEDVDTD
jgi:transcriptional regulator with XRE-family HTH domain